MGTLISTADANMPKLSHFERMRQISLTDAIEMAESKKSKAGLLRGWGMYASETDLRVIRDRLLYSHEPTIQANYLRVFSNRAIPEFSASFLSLMMTMRMCVPGLSRQLHRIRMLRFANSRLSV
jgi:hypothetical protein